MAPAKFVQGWEGQGELNKEKKETQQASRCNRDGDEESMDRPPLIEITTNASQVRDMINLTGII
ncbi:hypothetical protein N7456_012324 [Penicillium angulare]|uniref:Uncharacterized protein n=1 Tax=Penicillium angulare TaxID=116970 RepID=A0A9W9K0M9_9EURO|nr:hypothetical protein N7456_012324 [Penicillium angulare]